MARISAAQREENLARYRQGVVELFWQVGWDELTYGRLSEHLGVRSSTLQAYFPNREAFGDCLKGKVFPVFIGFLDLSSRQGLVSSWTQALEEPRFRMVLELLLGNLVGKYPTDLGRQGLARLNTLLTEQLGEAAQQDLELLLGRSVLAIAQS
ncbi:TetR family transcriptional regulator [Ferrimonas marina]|uniref:Transcriptional regulator, TetR family n=1 Tax=Ferrimonas marina TaxID=299255 RepID=A0A1M5YRM1_9GAMM|nr:TetR family transcriptional regulator [Ferrimonas marina]SHI14695.1 transcriptional regulator, TetR family [Ferrimonas marina]